MFLQRFLTAASGALFAIAGKSGYIWAMKYFRADLHVHSRFSRATSSKLTVRHLSAWSMIKGLSVMSTGDFTHPAWREELRRDLVFDETTGLYKVREKTPVEAEIPGFTRPGEMQEPLFLIQAEISSIYKKNGAVRKIHNLVFMPDLDSADRLSAKLAAIGNITSDGRPILGLDSEKLLEMVLETDERGVLIPAHIWTPWFALFGSKSGFDSLEDCFGSLSPHIFALETGLSSDPDMNRLWSKLDKYALVSNSDAHSGENLGREANLFTGTPSYDGLFGALRRAAAGQPGSGDCLFKGTVEFFPEEGKYHLDGHRACNVVLEPEEALKLDNICPVCGKPLTVGVLHRVKALADRKEPVQLKEDPGFISLIPLPEMIGEILNVGAKSRKVQTRQAELTHLFGSELDILHTVSESDLRQHWEPLGEAVARMRRGDVIREGGYDGEYGVVRVFTESERKTFLSGRLHAGSLLETTARPTTGAKTTSKRTPKAASSPLSMQIPHQAAIAEQAPDPAHFPYSEAQQQAIKAGPHPILVLAGPGSGKTRTLVGRIQRLLQEGTPPDRILAVTFTRRAAAELRERLALAMTDGDLPRADTLHALALSQWTLFEQRPQPSVLSEEQARNVFAAANPEISKAALRKSWEALSLARERLECSALTRTGISCSEEPCGKDLLERYTAYKNERNLADYTDLLERWLARLSHSTSDTTCPDYRPPWTEILIDEIQDFSPLQLALIRALLPAGSGIIPTGGGQGFFGIGDPDQAIYGFRGAQPHIQATLAEVWPDLETITLADSHRSAAGILHSASALLGPEAACGALTPTRKTPACLHLFTAPDAGSEAAWIAEQTARLLGGTSHTLEDTRSSHKLSPLPTPCSPGEIAILVRMKTLLAPIQTALDRRGVPCSVPEAAPFWADPTVAALLNLAGNHFGKPVAPFLPLPTESDLSSDAQTIPDMAWAGGPATVAEALGSKPPFDTLFRQSTAFHGLVNAYKEQGHSWDALLDWICLRQDLDLVKEQAEHVQIMTLHAAKGLEFRAVFLPALEEGLLPYQGMDALLHPDAAHEEKKDAIAEERRLLYVGLTRARDAVFASCAEHRKLYGHMLKLPPSRFLAALPDLFQQSRLVRHTQTTTRQISLF